MTKVTSVLGGTINKLKLIENLYLEYKIVIKIKSERGSFMIEW